MLKIGQQAPINIVVANGEGEAVSLGDMLGLYVVLYAYPKDQTPGCVKEACSIRDVYAEFKELGVTVIGISADSAVSHKKFTDAHKLNFPLWSDVNHELLTALGVWGKKKFMGKTYMGITRTTFLIDKEGRVVHVWENVKPEGHGEDVLAFVKENIAQ
jgi:peroxiredoxin Q/BCP